MHSFLCISITIWIWHMLCEAQCSKTTSVHCFFGTEKLYEHMQMTPALVFHSTLSSVLDFSIRIQKCADVWLLTGMCTAQAY